MHSGDSGLHSADSGLKTHSGDFLLKVEGLVRTQQFQTWFRQVSCEDLGEEGIRLFVPNRFVRDWITSYYSDVLAQAAAEAFGEDRRVSIEIDPNAVVPATVEVVADSVDANAGPATIRPRSLEPFSDTILHDEYTFANFVVGSSNRFAHAAATAVAESPGKSYNPFFLHGSVGLGKTHLLQAVCYRILERNPRARILYLSCESFINHFIQALENNDLSTFRHRYRDVDVLLVDDIQLLANKERTQEEFFHTFNTIYNLGRQIVLSSDAPPKDIPTLQERLVSRFKMGLVVEVDPPDFETRVNILRRKALLRDHVLPDDVTQFMAENISTNIRELEGAVIRLIGYSSLVDQPVSLELAKEALLDGSGSKNNAITIHDIVSVVTRYYSVKLSDLQSKRRTQSIAFPRQVCMYLARKTTNLSLEEIGGYFGGRDHTTVLYAADKIHKLSEADNNHGELLKRLTREIQNS